MRRALWLLAALLLWATPAAAAISYGQELHCTTVSSSSCTSSSATTSGNLFVAAVTYYTAAGLTSVTDSKSNSYASVVTAFTDGSGVTGGTVVAATGATSGASHTFTLTMNAAAQATMSVIEVQGALAASPLDQTATDTTSGATSHTTSSTATTAQANEILLGFGGSTDQDGGTGYAQTGAGWTLAYTKATYMGIITGYRVVSATGAYAYTFDTADGAYRSVQAITTWKEAAAAAGATQKCIGCGADRKVIE